MKGKGPELEAALPAAPPKAPSDLAAGAPLRSGQVAEPHGDGVDPLDSSTWVDLYGDYLFRFALFRVSQREIAEELVQDTFLAAHVAKERFEQRSSVKTWLVTILKNKIIDHFRKASREHEVSAESVGSEEAVNAAFNRIGIWSIWLNEWDSTPERLLEQKDFLTRLEQCVAKLPERLKRVFIARAVDDVETEELCKEMNISANNLWVMLYRARMQLRQCLDLTWFERGAKN